MDLSLQGGATALAQRDFHAHLHRRHYWWLTAIVTVALLVRVVQIDREALWADETLTLLIRHWSAFDLLFRHVDPSPGLYYVVAKGLIPQGADVATARALSVLFGTASVIAMYAVGRLAFAPIWGLVAAAMLAVSPAMVDYSQEARAYSLLVMLVLVSAAGLLWWVRGLKVGRITYGAIVLFAVATVLAFYTHFTSIFWIIPAVIGGREITDRIGDKTARYTFLIAAAAMALTALPEVWRNLSQVRLGGLGFLRNLGFGDFLAGTGDVVLPSNLWNGRTGVLHPLSAAILLLILVYAGFRIWRSRGAVKAWARENPAAPLTIAALFLTPLLVWLFGYAIAPIFMPRSILLGVPGIVLLLVLVTRFEPRPFAAPVFLVASASALMLHGTVREKEPWNAVAQPLRSGMQAGDGIVMCPEWQAPSLLHALRGAPEQSLYAIMETNVVMMPPAANGATWEISYHETVIRWRQELQNKVRPRVFGRQSVGTPRRFWIVESLCSEDQKRLIRAWLGRGKERRLLEIPRTPSREGVRLSLFEGVPISRMVTPMATEFTPSGQ